MKNEQPPYGPYRGTGGGKAAKMKSGERRGLLKNKADRIMHKKSRNWIARP